MASRNVRVHNVLIYVIHRTNHASPAVHIVYIYILLGIMKNDLKLSQ